MGKSQKHSTWLFVCLLLLYISILYSNTFHVPFMLDDQVGIAGRSNLHLSEITIKNIVDTFFIPEENSKKLYRPLSCLSLALNYYIGKFNVRGYHVVNLMIHAISAIFLFKTLILILGLKKFSLKETEINCIAGLATILWAAHPIQTQAVTYIIQRMASLAAMFYLIGLWFYLKFRCSENFTNRKYFLVFSILFFSCAVLSKENAVLFPLGILFIELFFFDGYKKIQVHPVLFAFIACILLIVPLIFFFHTTSIEKILSAYDHRPFTLKQRLLTEPRILFFYIGQLLYPIPGKFSLSHSFVFSNSLFSPVTTALSIAGIGTLLGVALWKGKKYPLIGFPIIFYFSHHLIESTLIPLELAFEHRNYIPSFFLFLPLSHGMFKLLIYYQKNKKSLYYFLFFFITLIVFILGLATHMRNKDWQTVESLWTQAAKTAPNQIRPYAQLGWYFTEKTHFNPQKAYSYFKYALDKEISYNVFEKALLWLNIAKIFQHNNNDEEIKKSLINALDLITLEITKKPVLIEKQVTRHYMADINYYIANVFFDLDNTEKALSYIENALSLKKGSVYLNTKARFLIHTGQYDDALEILNISLNEDPDNWNTFFLLGKTFTSLNKYSKGLWFYHQAIKKTEIKKIQRSEIYLYIAENFYNAKKSTSGDRFLKKFISLNTIDQTINFINSYQGKRRKKLPIDHSEFIFIKLHREISSILNKTDNTL